MTVAALVSQAESGVDMVILDLTTSRLNVAEAIAQLRALSKPPKSIIAYGPHVQEAALQAAQEAGCDLVLTRGQFNAQMDELLARSV